MIQQEPQAVPLAEAVRKQSKAWKAQQRQAKTAHEAAPKSGTFECPFGFEMRADGLYKLPLSQEAVAVRIAGHFDVLAESRSEGNEDWGLLLAWRDRDQAAHLYLMPRAHVAGEANAVRSRLAAGGLFVSAHEGARAALADFLARVKSDHRVRTVPRVGWHMDTEGRAAFVLPDRSIGAVAEDERLLLDMDPPPSIYRARGDLDGWRDEVAARCGGNSRLVFAVSMSFAGPLLGPLSEEAGGVHLRGESSRGKTTALQVAASVWGAPGGPDGFVRQWRATGNALEATAAAHNDGVLILDEIGRKRAPTDLPP
jgi:putative DNA primase/helicase